MRLEECRDNSSRVKREVIPNNRTETLSPLEKVAKPPFEKAETLPHFYAFLNIKINPPEIPLPSTSEGFLQNI